GIGDATKADDDEKGVDLDGECLDFDERGHDHHVWQDFSCVTPWEHFVNDIENTLRDWASSPPLSHPPSASKPTPVRGGRHQQQLGQSYWSSAGSRGGRALAQVPSYGTAVVASKELEHQGRFYILRLHGATRSERGSPATPIGRALLTDGTEAFPAPVEERGEFPEMWDAPWDWEEQGYEDSLRELVESG
ncbi:unnamed protein product, partial [Discosporangium mesarthrocarpum]